MSARTLVPTTLAAWLLIAATAFAGAGSGTSSYGGGGSFSGGGGSSFSGGGSGGSTCAGDCSMPGWLAALIVLGIVVFLGGTLIMAAVATVRLRRRKAARVRAVELASAEAADDDAAFAADLVRKEAAELFVALQEAWDARDHDRLQQLIGKDLWAEWKRRLADFERKGWHNRVEVVGAPKVDYVGLINRAEDREDRVTVHVEATTRDSVVNKHGGRIMRNGETDATTTTKEFWTLGKRPDGKGWRLLSIQQAAEGLHHLDAAIVANPWGDDVALRDEAIAERAAADAAPAGFSPAELADLDFDGTARAAALDLALADGRFDPDLIEASVRRAVDAWAEAVDGEDAPLEAVAREDAVRELLHPGDGGARTRLVVRGPRIEQVRIADLDAAATPPTIGVELSVRGRRYVEHRDTAAVVSGSRDTETAFTERWVLALDGEGEWPWRIAATGAPTPA